MGALFTGDYERFEATQNRVAENKAHAKNAVAKHYRGQHAGDPIEMAIAERGVILEPPQTAADFSGDAHASPSETLNLDLYGKVMAERLRRRLMAAESVEAR